jgi:hypothetical protein
MLESLITLAKVSFVFLTIFMVCATGVCWVGQRALTNLEDDNADET